MMHMQLWIYVPPPHFLKTSLSPRAHRDVVGMLRFVFDINKPNLPTPFYFLLESASVIMAQSTVSHSINSPDNSPLSHSVLSVLFLSDWSSQLYIYVYLYENLPLP